MTKYPTNVDKRKRNLKRVLLNPKLSTSLVPSKSRSEVVVSGGVMYVKVERSDKQQGRLKLMSVPSRTPNSYGVFIAGGDKVDRLVASANAGLSFTVPRPAAKRRAIAVLRDLLQHRINKE